MPCDYKKYPHDWKLIRERILERDSHKCKFCGIENYSVVKWDKNLKKWERACGNIHIDAYGNGECSYKEARSLVEHWNDMEEDGKWIVIVLTIMHLDHDTTNNADNNLASGCQRCHNNYDQGYRRKNARATIDKKRGLQKLF